MTKPFEKKICGLRGYLLASLEATLLEAWGFTLLGSFYDNKETLLFLWIFPHGSRIHFW
jgi:hypothetical protein